MQFAPFSLRKAPVEELGHKPAADRLHGAILRSTTVIGGSSAVNVIFRMVQAKAAALLIGASGVGLMGLLNSALDLAGTVAGMGLATSGVRQVAETAAASDEARLARIVRAFRWIAVSLGLVGALAFFCLRRPIARITFGTDQHSSSFGWLSIALLLSVVSGAQVTLIRGMRRIGDLARVSVFGIAIATVAGIPLLYFWGTQGIAPYLILNALTTAVVSWWFARKIHVARIPLSLGHVLSEARALLGLGVAFMFTSLTTTATTYLMKILVSRQLGLEATGLYVAASALSNVYVGFILGAMQADFFPHLASLSQDRVGSGRLINAQVEIGVLLATPGILAVLALGPFLLQVLYSAQFRPGFAVVRWLAVGTYLQVISWPVAMVMLTMKKGTTFFISELAANLVFIAVSLLGISRWGLAGIGMAFLCMYVFYVCLVTVVSRRLIGFAWSARNLRLVSVLAPVILAAFLGSLLLSPVLSAVLGLALAAGVGVYALYSLKALSTR